jgi:hypothetical protein
MQLELIFASKCAKTHLRSSVDHIFSGIIPWEPHAQGKGEIRRGIEGRVEKG